MDMERYWGLGDLYTAIMNEVEREWTYHEQHRNRSPYLDPNKHDQAIPALSHEHLGLVKVWGAYHFSSWPPETVNRLEKELADWKEHCALYHPACEALVTTMLEVALAEFQAVL